MHLSNGTNGPNGIIHLVNGSNGTNGVNGAHSFHGFSHDVYHTNEYIPVETPVLIIGGGPTGLLLSHLLSRLGLKSTIVERYPERLGAPKAHALSPRSLEICRQFGLDVRRVRNLGTPELMLSGSTLSPISVVKLSAFCPTKEWILQFLKRLLR